MLIAKHLKSSIGKFKKQMDTEALIHITYMGMAAMIEHQMTSMFISKLLSTKI